MGYKLGFIQLDDAESITEISERVEKVHKKPKTESGQLGSGKRLGRPEPQGKRYPTRQDLDAASPNNPVALTRICGHMIILNTRALKSVRITKSTPNPPGALSIKTHMENPQES